MFKTVVCSMGCKLRCVSRSPCVQITQTRNIRYFKRTPIDIISNDPVSKGATLEDYKKFEFSRPGDDRIILDAETLHDEITDDAFFENEVLKDNFESKEIVRRNQKNERTESLLRDIEQKKTKNKVQAIVKSKDGGQIKIFGLHTKKFSTDQSLIKMLKCSRMKALSVQNDCLFVEGWRIIADFLVAGIKPKGIFYSRTNTLAKMMSIMKMKEFDFVQYLNLLPIYQTPYDVISTWSAVKTPPGIMAVFPLSEAQKLVSTPKMDSIPITVILDGIKDPQNLGGLMRSIAAAGVHQTILTKGCCDPWDIRSIRASSGAVLKLHFLTDVVWSAVRNYIPDNSDIFLAHACHDTESDGIPFKNYENVPKKDKPHNKKNIENKDRVTRDPDMDNINTEDRHIVPDHGDVTDTYVYAVDDAGLQYDASYDDPEILRYCTNISIPTESYDCAKFFNKSSSVLIIGSERGLGPECRKLASENGGIEVNIPMKDGIDSLNSNAAGAIILFEMSRQYRMSIKKQLVNKQ